MLHHSWGADSQGAAKFFDTAFPSFQRENQPTTRWIGQRTKDLIEFCLPILNHSVKYSPFTGCLSRARPKESAEPRVQSEWVGGDKMIRIELVTQISAPIELVFDLARDLDLHQKSASQTKERIVAGRTSGLAQLGDEITFEATHFGVRQKLTSKIIELDQPHRFVDQMIKGAFKSLHHIHEFKEHEGGTMMRDILSFEAPLGPLGVIAEKLFLASYMRRFLAARNDFLKIEAESRYQSGLMLTHKR